MTTEYNLANLNTYLKKVISSVSGIKNKEKVISRIVSLLDEASQIVDLSLSDLLDGLDFQPNNYQVEKFEAFLAELRSIFWLSHFGFTEIAPLPKKKKSKNPDFKAKINNKNVVVEVFCLTKKHQQKRDSRLGVFINSYEKLEKSFAANIQKVKKGQISSIDSEVKLLICVVNSDPISRLNTKEDFISILTKVA